MKRKVLRVAKYKLDDVRFDSTVLNGPKTLLKSRAANECNLQIAVHCVITRGRQIFSSERLLKDDDNLKATGLQLFPKDVYEFLRKVVNDSLAYRKEHNLTIPDYMDILKELSEEYPIDDLAGQLFFAFLAGFETVSGILRFCFHELTLHPNIQERLYQEIRKHEEMELMTLESINGLKYLDCVFTETSRKWSPAVILDRICTKPYLLPPPREGGKPYLLKPGHMIFNVVNAINTDPKYYENPETFDPERFSEENKHKIKWCTISPFGMGPRSCLAARFSTLEVKVMIYYMVLNFKLVKCEKTTDQIALIPDELKVNPVGGTWTRLEPRE